MSQRLREKQELERALAASLAEAPVAQAAPAVSPPRADRDMPPANPPRSVRASPRLADARMFREAQAEVDRWSAERRALLAASSPFAGLDPPGSAVIAPQPAGEATARRREVEPDDVHMEPADPVALPQNSPLRPIDQYDLLYTLIKSDLRDDPQSVVNYFNDSHVYKITIPQLDAFKSKIMADLSTKKGRYDARHLLRIMSHTGFIISIRSINKYIRALEYPNYEYLWERLKAYNMGDALTPEERQAYREYRLLMGTKGADQSPFNPFQ